MFISRSSAKNVFYGEPQNVSTTYDYAIAVDRLRPPRSVDHHYAARVTRLVRQAGPLAEEYAPAAYGITEVWGRTPDEARHKLERRLQHWIARELAADEEVRLPVVA